jgi:hypothetical protein
MSQGHHGDSPGILRWRELRRLDSRAGFDSRHSRSRGLLQTAGVAAPFSHADERSINPAFRRVRVKIARIGSQPLVRSRYWNRFWTRWTFGIALYCETDFDDNSGVKDPPLSRSRCMQSQPASRRTLRFEGVIPCRVANPAVVIVRQGA